MWQIGNFILDLSTVVCCLHEVYYQHRGPKEIGYFHCPYPLGWIMNHLERWWFRKVDPIEE